MCGHKLKNDSTERPTLNTCSNCGYFNQWSNVNCVNCGEELPNAIVETEPVPQPAQAMETKQVGEPPPAVTKICPYCAETIKAAAIVCRYCGRDVPTEEAKGQPVKTPKKQRPAWDVAFRWAIGIGLLSFCGKVISISDLPDGVRDDSLYLAAILGAAVTGVIWWALILGFVAIVRYFRGGGR